jgi:hypothetical protein
LSGGTADGAFAELDVREGCEVVALLAIAVVFDVASKTTPLTKILTLMKH